MSFFISRETMRAVASAKVNRADSHHFSSVEMRNGKKT